RACANGARLSLVPRVVEQVAGRGLGGEALRLPALGRPGARRLQQLAQRLATRGCPRAERRVSRAQLARTRGCVAPRATTASARRAGACGCIQLRAAGLPMTPRSTSSAETHRLADRHGSYENLPRIAVVGMSAIMPDAPDLDAFWRNIARGVDCVREV